MLTSASAAPAAATLPLFLPQAPPDTVSGIFHAATLLAQLLGQGRALDSRALRSADVVLGRSAGTGLLAIFAEIAKARLALNEIADTRAGLLGRLFRDVAATRHNAEQIHDRLDPAIRPSVVLMNPPFSASPHVDGRFAEAAMRHMTSALARLAAGGRLVVLTGRNVGPDQPAWRHSFVRLQEKGRVLFTATP